MDPDDRYASADATPSQAGLADVMASALLVLQEELRLTDDQARQLLAQTAAFTGRTADDVADHLVTTGDLPRRRSR